MDNQVAPAVDDGKAFHQAAEDAYDTIASEHGVDDNGDEIVVDDDEPALSPEGVEVAAEAEDEPALIQEELEPEPDLAAHVRPCAQVRW